MRGSQGSSSGSGHAIMCGATTQASRRAALQTGNATLRAKAHLQQQQVSAGGGCLRLQG